MVLKNALAVALLAGSLAACHPPEAADPAVLRFSAIPDQTPDRVHAQHEALVQRVCASAGQRCRLVAASSYEALVDSIGRGDVDLAFLGGVTFIQAHQRYGAVPLAMRDIDLRFTSVIVVRKDDPARTLADLRGRSFSFGNRTSTSGHFMLRHRLQGQGIVAEQHFSRVGFSATHDQTMHAVTSGAVDAGGLNASVYYAREIEGSPEAAGLRVIWQSAPYIDYVWAARPGLSPALRQQLLNAFLDLDRANPGDREALARERAGGFLPAYAEDFDEIREARDAQSQRGGSAR